MIRSNYIRRGVLALCMLIMTMAAWAQHDSDSLKNDFSKHHQQDNYRKNLHGDKLKQTQHLDEVVVRGNQVKRVNSSAFNVMAVDTRRLRNTNLDLAHVLDRVSGVKVREDGGLGSGTSINLNGFTGKHVRLFIDGVPMDGASSSSSINNITVKNGKGSYFIAVKTDNGTEYIMQTNSMTAGNLDIRNNIMELPQTEYTWVFNNHDAIGMVYQQQFAGLGYGLRWTSDDSQFSKLGEFRIDTRFSNYGFFNGQLLTSVGGQVSADGKRNDGATFAFWNITNDGVKLDHTKTI